MIQFDHDTVRFYCIICDIRSELLEECHDIGRKRTPEYEHLSGSGGYFGKMIGK